jgi:hypothetical protein
MYSNVHAATGLAITESIYEVTKSEPLALAIGLPLAIVSHYFMDFLFEKGLSKKEVLIYDILPSFLYVALAFFSGYFWLFMLSWWAGNLFDLIDKKIYLTIFLPSKYKPTFYFHNQKHGIKFNLKQTKIASIVSTLIILCIFLIIK